MKVNPKGMYYMDSKIKDKNVDFLFLEQKHVRHERYDCIKRITDTKQQRYADKRRLPCPAKIKDKRSPVINRIRHYRFK